YEWGIKETEYWTYTRWNSALILSQNSQVSGWQRAYTITCIIPNRSLVPIDKNFDLPGGNKTMT
ncbi:hypothetical protein M404DRAFT_999123, partial [Pisolithus tinctorius Marx 270]